MRRNDVPDPLGHLLDEDGAPLRDVADDLRAMFVEDPDPAVATVHLARIVETAAEHAHQAPVPPTLGQQWRRRAAHVFGLTTVKLALGAGIAVAATSGLAATGNLPDPVQRVVSDSVARIGVHWPAPPAAEIDPPAGTTPPDADDAGPVAPPATPPPPDDAASPPVSPTPALDEASPTTSIPEPLPTPSFVPSPEAPTPTPPVAPGPPEEPSSDPPGPPVREPSPATSHPAPQPDEAR
jgi:hypothetical protein